MGFVICHRQFEGDHEDSETCWCRPVVINADTATAEEVDAAVVELNREDG